MMLNRKKSGQEGYVLLALMLAVTLILIALSIEAPRIAQQIKRDKEEEMIHRGMDYATAVKRFVHKNGGRYPLSIEQLENTNHIRFLRKRYKDPMTGEDNWRLVHVGEAQIKIPAPPAGSLQTTNPGLGGGTASQGPSPGAGGTTNQPLGSNNAPTLSQPFQSGGGVGQTNQVGSLTTSNIGNGQPVGGGQIIGVASVSKKQSIRMFNDKDHYNDWFFVYDLRLEQAGGKGITIAEPSAGVNTSGDQSGQGQQQSGTSQTNGASGSTSTPAQKPN
jgi:type II secretory pathway pseudopilin PulG